MFPLEKNAERNDQPLTKEAAPKTVFLLRQKCPVETLGHGFRGVSVSVCPGADDRAAPGNRHPIRQGQIRAGLQRQQEIRRGIENDGCGVGV